MARPSFRENQHKTAPGVGGDGTPVREVGER